MPAEDLRSLQVGQFQMGLTHFAAVRSMIEILCVLSGKTGG